MKCSPQLFVSKSLSFTRIKKFLNNTPIGYRVPWKRLNSEKDQYGNRPKQRKPIAKMEFFQVFSCFFKSNLKSLNKTYFWGISHFFYRFLRFLGRIPVFTGQIFLRGFPINQPTFSEIWKRTKNMRKRIKKKETNQQTENLWLFPKTGN